MKIEITARHCELDDVVREKAESLAKKWPRYDGTSSHARIVFEATGAAHTVDIQVSRDRQEPVAVRGEGADFRSALDEADDRIRRILRKDKQKRRDHQAEPADFPG
ncbi:MAG: HPF/RaiA family ribosome-associated protein [Gemmatimonadota bacterium]|nr:HPF/RaiA family ribosome-associated protein [Gemmatimonadota bacterium]